MNLDELMAEIIRACPYPMEGKHIVGQKDYGIQLRNAIRGVLEPEWEKLHSPEIMSSEDVLSDMHEILDLKGHLSLLLGWIDTGIPEQEHEHSCGTDASCDQNCVTFAEFCRDVNQAKKAIGHKTVNIIVKDGDPTKIIDEAKFMLYNFVSIREDGPKEGWTKYQHRLVGNVFQIEEIDWGKKDPIRLNCSSTIWWSPEDLTLEKAP